MSAYFWGSIQWVIGLIAGGTDAFVKAKEGARRQRSLREGGFERSISLKAEDIVHEGLTASGRTPYVIRR